METNPTTAKELTPEEIQAGYDSNDMNIINGVVDGSIQVKHEEAAEVTPEVIPTGEAANSTTLATDPPAPEEDERSLLIKRAEANEEHLRNYIAQVEQEKKDESSCLASERMALAKVAEDERKKREEVEQRIREMEAAKPIEAPAAEPSIYTDDDEDLVSDYSKSTRKMLEEVKGSLSSTDPKYTELNERIKKFEEGEAERLQRDAQAAEERKQREVQKRLYDEVRSFQGANEDYATTEDFETLHQKFNDFTSRLSGFVNAKTPEDKDRALMTYFDETRGEKLRDETEKHGIVPPEDYDKYVEIAKLVDMTKGVEYDSVLRKFVQIKNSFGEPVRYRSIDEAYKVKNFSSLISDTRKEVSRQIRDKSTELNNRPVRIGNDETAPIESGLTSEQLSSVINNAEQYVFDKSNYALLTRAYASIGQEPPAYKGR